MDRDNATANWAARLILATVPARQSEPSVQHDVTKRISAIGWIFIGVVGGGVLAAVTVLAHQAVPGIGWVLWGMITGLLVGGGIAFVIAAKNPAAKGGGAFLLLTIPALVFLLPAALVYAAFRGARDRIRSNRRARGAG